MHGFIWNQWKSCNCIKSCILRLNINNWTHRESHETLRELGEIELEIWAFFWNLMDERDSLVNSLYTLSMKSQKEWRKKPWSSWNPNLHLGALERIWRRNPWEILWVRVNTRELVLFWRVKSVIGVVIGLKWRSIGV